MPELPRVMPGDPVTMEDWNALIDAINAARLSVEGAPGLILSADDNGYSLSMTGNDFLWAKTTGAISGGQYPWTEQHAASGGTWTAGTVTGTAYEANGNASVPTGTYILIERLADGTNRFWSDSC